MYTDGFRAWSVPASGRDEYLTLIDELTSKIGNGRYNDLGYDAYSDPIVKFNNFDVLSKNHQDLFIKRMKNLGAKDVTDVFMDC